MVCCYGNDEPFTCLSKTFGLRPQEVRPLHTDRSTWCRFNSAPMKESVCFSTDQQPRSWRRFTRQQRLWVRVACVHTVTTSRLMLHRCKFRSVCCIKAAWLPVVFNDPEHPSIHYISHFLAVTPRRNECICHLFSLVTFTSLAFQVHKRLLL